MTKQFNEWLDEFIDNGFDPENIGHWPEEGSEPVVVEELPEDPQFGKVYAIETSGETTYYTTDVNGDWINLTEGGQGGGIIEVEYLSEATEPNVTYNVTIGDGEYGAGLYYSMLDNSENLIFIYIDDLNYIDTSGAVVLEQGEVLKRANNDACYINIDSGEQSSDTYYPYYYSSNSTEILDAIYPHINEWQKTGAYYVSSGGSFSTPSEGAILVPHVQSSNETYYEEIGPISSDQILIYNNPYTSELEFSSGEFDLWYNNGSGFTGANGYDNMEDILTGMYGNSDGAFTSGMIYYPQVNASSGQDYYETAWPFVALIAPLAYFDNRGGWMPNDYNWNQYTMQPGTTYQIVESSGSYSLQAGGGASYFTSETDARNALRNSIDHEVSSGEVFDSIYYPTLSSGERSYQTVWNDKNGIWLCTETSDTGHSVDGDTVYGYYGYPLGFSGDTQRLMDSDICRFLTIAKTGKNGFDTIDDVTFWNRADSIFYPIDSSGARYTSQQWTNSVANVILYHNNNCCTTTFTSGQLAYMEFYSSGQYAQLNAIDLPTTSTPVTVTIDGVNYTITKNE